MTTGEVIRLTRDAMTQIVSQLPQEQPEPHDGPENRQYPRWPSHGTVELRPLHSRQASGKSGTVRNICEGGLGMSSEHYFELDSVREIVVHLPHASFRKPSPSAYNRVCP